MLPVVYLLLKRGEDIFLLPDSSIPLEINDQLLVVSDDDTKEDFEYIINNIYELDYILYGKDITLSLPIIKLFQEKFTNS